MTEGLQAFNDALINDLLPVIGTFVGLLASRYIISILKRLAQRFNLEYESRYDAKVEYVVDKWIRYAEEHVEKLVRENLVDATEKGFIKAETAVAGIVDEIPGVSKEMAHILVHAALTKYGLGVATKAVKAGAGALTEQLPKPQAPANGTAQLSQS